MKLQKLSYEIKIWIYVISTSNGANGLAEELGVNGVSFVRIMAIRAELARSAAAVVVFARNLLHLILRNDITTTSH